MQAGAQGVYPIVGRLAAAAADVARQVRKASVIQADKVSGAFKSSVGVKVPVQVMPPSLLARPVSVPLLRVRSALVKPVTASLKVKVSVAVSPTFNAVSLMAIATVGRCVSRA